MNYKQWVVVIIMFCLLSLLGATAARAAIRCETQYGGGEICVRTGNLQVNKKVCDPKKGSCDPNSSGFDDRLVDNLGILAHKFVPGDEVVFKLLIKNVGDAALAKVSVSDTLPSFLELVSAELSFDLSDLTPGETETRVIRTKVISAEKFPNDKTVLCEVNTAEARSGDEQDKDTSQVCAEKKVLGVVAPKVLPKAGPEGLLIALFASILAGSYGAYLLRFSKIYKK